MVENICTHFLKQFILGLKVAVECASAHICLVQYLLNSYIVEMFFFQQLVESLKYCTSSLLLSTIHIIYLRTNYLICSVTNNLSHLVIVRLTPTTYDYIKQFVHYHTLCSWRL